MKNVLIAAAALIFSAAAGAACPVGKDEGDTWCDSKGRQWKCERCGSEYCPIITGQTCNREDGERVQGALQRILLSEDKPPVDLRGKQGIPQDLKRDDPKPPRIQTSEPPPPQKPQPPNPVGSVRG